MDQVFILKLEQAGFDRLKLTALLNEIDSDKRSVTSYLQDVSSGLNESAKLTGRERQDMIRRLTDKKRFLTDQREMVRQRLGRIGFYKKALNKATNNQKLGFAAAFLAAAEITLSEAQFEELEAVAGEILMCTADDEESAGNR